MEDSTTTSEWSFSFEDPKPVFDTDRVNMSQPYLSGAGRWDNYCDDELYNLECLIRDWLETKRGGWGTSDPSARKFTAKMVYEIITGKKDPSLGTIRKLNRLLAHYSTRTYKNGNTTIYGKKINNVVYFLNATRLDHPPYSLRLRLEWLADRGELPTYGNMELVYDLKPGEVRRINRKTEANRRKREREVKRVRAEKRARNNEQYGNNTR